MFLTPQNKSRDRPLLRSDPAPRPPLRETVPQNMTFFGRLPEQIQYTRATLADEQISYKCLA